MLPSYIRVRAVVSAYGRGDTRTDTQTRVTTIHFASSTTHAKCNDAKRHDAYRLNARWKIGQSHASQNRPASNLPHHIPGHVHQLWNEMHRTQI